MQIELRSADARAYRITSIDVLRGLVIVIMALDHVRDLFMSGAKMDPFQNPDVGVALYFTRWITHFCAPVFVFLAGTSAGLMAARKSPTDLARFLFTRGLWLIAIEVTVVSTGITFAPLGSAQFGGKILVALQVIWAIGVSMTVLAACQFLGRKACLLLGALIVLGHNALDPIWPAPALGQADTPLWVGLHAQIAVITDTFFIFNVYPVIPWIGVMLLGFGSAAVFEQPADARKRSLLCLGLALTAGFVVLRALDVYGDPNAWQPQPGGFVRTLLDFLNTTKYPPSLLYSLMTLGPAAIFCAFAERWSGALKDVLVTYGRVPFAFYVVHWYLAHTLCVVLAAIQGVPVTSVMDIPGSYPPEFGLPLAGVYVVWFLIVGALYPWCRWMANLKSRNRSWWLSYV
jgi:uncharacterized membrane protein